MSKLARMDLPTLRPSLLHETVRTAKQGQVMDAMRWSLVFDVILPLAGTVGVIVILLSPANDSSINRYEWPGDDRGEPFRED